MILETILSSVSEDGKVNFAPMGVHLPNDCLPLSEIKEIGLALYPGSHTFSNLRRVPEGVINFTDDILSFVNTALFSDVLPAVPSYTVRPPRMAAAKTVWEFSVTRFDDSECPARVTGKVLRYQESGGYSGFCRAQGAVLEAVIAATRLPWIPKSTVLDSWPAWEDTVTKTGGVRELIAFRKLAEYFAQQGVGVHAPEHLRQRRR